MNRQLTNLIPKIMLLSAIVLLASVGPTQAQSLGNRIRVNIPFDFKIAEKKLPAGEYSVGRAANWSNDLVVSVNDLEGRSKAIRLSNAVVRSRPNEKALLVFHRYADQYFLFQVWPAGATTGREFRKSKSEREAQQQLARDSARGGVAENGTFETVTIVGVLQ
jgi:hypothetical protein